MILDDIIKPIIIKDFTSTLYSEEYNVLSASCNFSIIENSTYGGKYIVILRYYGRTPELRVTINKGIILDKNFNIIKTKIYKTNNNDYIAGIEDVRLINYNNNLYISGNKIIEVLDHNNIVGFPGRIGVQISKFDFNKETLEDNIYITPTFIKKQEMEKNWVYFIMNNNTYFIYKWFPLTITELNNNKLEIYKKIDMPIAFKNIRGSTNGVIINNEIWFLVHEKIKDYYHKFVVFDLNMNLIKYSNQFKFIDKPIEFVLSMIKYNDSLLLSYSHTDNHCYLKQYSYDELNNKLEWSVIKQENFTNNNNNNIIIIIVIAIALVLIFNYTKFIKWDC
jgi:hypothetical protein